MGPIRNQQTRLVRKTALQVEDSAFTGPGALGITRRLMALNGIGSQSGDHGNAFGNQGKPFMALMPPGPVVTSSTGGMSAMRA